MMIMNNQKGLAMKKNIPKFKQNLIEKLKTISEDKDFIISVGSAAGGNEEDAQKVIDFIEKAENAISSDVIAFALQIYYEKHPIK